VPIAVAYLWRRRGRQGALTHVAAFAGVAIACFLPFVILAPHGLRAMFADQLDRPLQVESLGAKFVAVEDEEFKQAETAAGYAKEMSKEYQAKQAALVAEHIKKQDIVVTTALIPGRPAPRLLSREMVLSMRPGSVIVDLAVERGGNCELAKPGAVVTVNEVKVVGLLNLPGRVAASASSLYARNLFAFLEVLVDKKQKVLAVSWDDEIVKATALTREGAVIHPSFAPKSAA